MPSDDIVPLRLPTLDNLFSSCQQNITSERTLLISLIGAGGKTSALFWLARELYQRGRRVLVTTTTQMFLPEDRQYRHLVIAKHPEQYLQALAALPQGAAQICLFSHLSDEKNKVAGFSPQEIDRLKASEQFDVILVEADGSRRLPLKAPAGHEPCIPDSSDVVIAVTGREVIERPARPERIHRWEIFSALTGVQAGETLSCEVFSTFIAHPQGMFKGTPQAAKRVWLINRCYQSDSALLSPLSQLLARQETLSALWLGAVQETPPCCCCLMRSARE